MRAKEYSAPRLPIGTKLWQPDGTMYHVRGYVDGQLVVRTWFRSKRRWHYDFADWAGFHVGLYSGEKPTSRRQKKTP